MSKKLPGTKFALRSLHLDPKRLHAEMRRSLLQDIEEQIRLVEQEQEDAQDKRQQKLDGLHEMQTELLRSLSTEEPDASALAG